MDFSQPEPWVWLTGPEGDECMRLLSNNPKLIFNNVPKKLVDFALHQVQLRRKGESRFGCSGKPWFWTDTLLQQASDWRTALYKASRYPKETMVVDLCCGAGADLAALALRGPAIGIDLDSIACILADANVHSQGCETVEVKEGDVLDILEDCEDWVHIDPDRRPDGQRVTRGENMEPPLDSFFELLDHTPGGAIKLAPASQLEPAWLERVSLEWIGTRRECRQQVAWWGLEKTPTNLHTATVLKNDGTHISFQGDPLAAADLTADVENYLYDFQPPIRAAGLTNACAEHFHISSLGSSAGYLTSSEKIVDPLLDCYRVDATLGWDEKRVKALLRERKIGKLTVKKRGCAGLDPNQLERSLVSKGEEEGILLLAEVGKRRIAVLCLIEPNNQPSLQTARS